MRKSKARILFYSSLVFAVLFAGFIGYLVGNQNLKFSKNFVPEIAKKDIGRPSDVDFSLFWEAYDKLKSNYVGELDAKQLLYRAIAGSFTATDDPYTNFLPPEETKKFEGELGGELEGIGVKIGVLDKAPAVIAPLPDSPAQKAGLKAKDKILKIDDQETSSMTMDEAVDKIRGKKGTTVKLTIMRSGQEKVFEIKREKIAVETVELSYKNDVAILVLNEFGTETKGEFQDAVKQIKNKNISKVVLDLRNNPGGLLDGAVDVASELLAQDKLVVVESGKGYKRELKTVGPGTLQDSKLVVLVNGGSASAAEILAGAIKDYNRGKLIGEKTFGKGTVQQYESLSDGSSVKITVAKWLTPNGASIDKNGITPDIEIKEGDDALFDDNDPLLTRAIEELGK